MTWKPLHLLIFLILFWASLIPANAKEELQTKEENSETNSEIQVPVKDMRGIKMSEEDIASFAKLMSHKFDGLVFALQLNGKYSERHIKSTSDSFDAYDGDAYDELKRAAKRIIQDTDEFVAILITDAPDGFDRTGVYNRGARTSIFMTVTAINGGFEDAVVDAGLEAIEMVKMAKARILAE